MDIREERAGDVLVLSPDGDLGSPEDSRALEQQLARALSAGSLFVVLDCGRVGHVTSAAIRALLLASRKLARAKGRLVLCAMTPKVQKAFSLSGFDRDFAVVAVRDEAVRLALEPVVPQPRSGAQRAAASVEPGAESKPTGVPLPEAPVVTTPARPPHPKPAVPAADAGADVTVVRTPAPSSVPAAVAAPVGRTPAPALAAPGAALDRTVVLTRAPSPSTPVPAADDEAAVATAARLLAALGAGAAAAVAAPAPPSAGADGVAAALLRSLGAPTA